MQPAFEVGPEPKFQCARQRLGEEDGRFLGFRVKLVSHYLTSKLPRFTFQLLICRSSGDMA
jgi:hypothetical protein